MAYRTFRYADVVLGVLSDRADDLDWLAEFLAPAFAVDDGSEPGPRPELCLELREDAAALQALLASRPADAPPQPWLSLDTELVALPAWETGAGTALHDERRGCVYLDGPGALNLVTAPDSSGRRLAAMRVLRELAAQGHRRAPGRLPLHAAALEADGEALLLAGPKQAGKTTLLVHLARALAGRLISNDRVFVELDGGPPRVRGMPTAVSLRPGTLERFPELARALPDRPGLSQHTLAEVAAFGARTAFPAGRPLRISPALLCERLGVGAVAAAPLGAVLLSCVDPQVSGWRLLRLPPGAAAGRLWGCRYGATAGGARTRLDARLPGAAVDDLRASCAALAAAVPVFECRLGPDAYDAPDAAAELCAAARAVTA